jgi:hypothetical protein
LQLGSPRWNANGSLPASSVLTMRSIKMALHMAENWEMGPNDQFTFNDPGIREWNREWISGYESHMEWRSEDIEIKT